MNLPLGAMLFMVVILRLVSTSAQAQVIDGVAVCCGRPEGFRNNQPPLDSRRFGQQFSGRLDYPQTPSTRHEPEASYPPNFGAYSFEDGGYDPGTGTMPPPLRPGWWKDETGWPTDNIDKYFDSH